jgi:hypothetical protein
MAKTEESGNGKITSGGLVRNAWRSAPPVLRRFALTVFIVGLISAAAFVVIDLEGMWSNLQFTSNILSEIVGAMVAFPVALVVVNQLTAYQVEEANRTRLDNRIRLARNQLVEAMLAASEHLSTMESEASSATNEFVEATQRGADHEIGDTDKANNSLQALVDQLDSTQWALYEQHIAPVRILSVHLQSLLTDRDRNGDYIAEVRRFAELSTDLETAMRRQHEVMERGHHVFATSPPLNAHDAERTEPLRTAAFEHLTAMSRVMTCCRELEHYVRNSGTITW